MKSKVRATKCMVQGCKRMCNGRGLCATHYKYARDLVVRGKTTWTSLEANGKCLPVSRKISGLSYKWFRI